jgi:radical SAM superfamily enzyme YgiQ (UPF0313 family)
MTLRIALVNTNRMKPAIAPVGLDYVAEALHHSGHQVDILDLCWSKNCESDVQSFFLKSAYALVGVTLRNTDDCAFTSHQSFIREFADIIQCIRNVTDASIVAGGVGFSTLPQYLLERTHADFGIWGEGELAMVQLAKCLEHSQEWQQIPNLIWKDHDAWRLNPPSTASPDGLPVMTRAWFDTPRYFREGGQIGFETKRGCPFRCIYCADPVAKGNKVKPRSPMAVVAELKNLLEQKVDHLHTCDAEFNLLPDHSKSVCDAIVQNGLSDKLRWYAYCTPAFFSKELAKAMRRAGCVGINFGIDNGDDRMLKRLRRGFQSSDIRNAAQYCLEAGIVTMFDLLLGSPGESEQSLRHTIELVKKCGADRIGVAIGVRVYPGTALANLVKAHNYRAGLTGSDDPEQPLFYLEPAVQEKIYEILQQCIGDDSRFLFFNPDNPDKNYNYNANQRLVDAIRDGARGAYWDILRGLDKQ